jgi:hypothetical protein
MLPRRSGRSTGTMAARSTSERPRPNGTPPRGPAAHAGGYRSARACGQGTTMCKPFPPVVLRKLLRPNCDKRACSHRVVSTTRSHGTPGEGIEIDRDAIGVLDIFHTRPPGIAEVPGRDATAKHRTVVLFRVLHEPRVLFRIEKLIGSPAPIMTDIVRGAPPQLDELADHLVLARLRQAKASRMAVGLGVLTEVLEAPISGSAPVSPPLGPPCRGSRAPPRSRCAGYRDPAHRTQSSGHWR